MTQPISGNNPTSLFGLQPGAPARWTVTNAPAFGHITTPAPARDATSRVSQMGPAASALQAESGANAELARTLRAIEGACGRMSANLPMGASACANPEAWTCAASLLNAAGFQPEP